LGQRGPPPLLAGNVAAARRGEDLTHVALPKRLIRVRFSRKRKEIAHFTAVSGRLVPEEGT
jgi:hypothetical protein